MNCILVIMKRLATAALVICLAGCATSLRYHYSEDQEELLMEQVLGDVTAPTDLATLYLDDEIKRALDERIDDHLRDKHKVRELRAFLFSENERGISYDATATRTAAETYWTGRGNCLAMTNLFVAAARHVGLDANYQIVSVRPTWDNEGSTMIRYEHIVAYGRIDNEYYIVDFLPEFLIGDQPTEVIDDLDAMALFYNNLGAEAVVDLQPELAISHLRKSLAINPDNSGSWNNMGAALRRAGRPTLAEFAYFQALEIDAYNYSALSNLARFYEIEGRAEEAEEIIARVDRYRQRNPYYHYFVAGVFFQDGQLEKAKLFLANAIHLKKDEPEFYEAAAQIAKVQEEMVEADRLLTRADFYRQEKFITPPERIMSSRLMVRKNM